MMKRIWIDLDNPPHVLLFKPIIRDLTARGHEVLVTARDHAYTCELLEEEKIRYRKIGRYYGKNILRKALGTVVRAFQLARFARNRQVNVAVSHGSRSLVLACLILSVPCVTLFDYEHVHSGIFNRFSAKILIPELVKEEPLFKQGLKKERLVKYPGIKEEIYLEPNARNETEFGFIRKDRINVLVRPAAETAHYHRDSSEKLLEKILEDLVQKDAVHLIVSPRTTDQYRRVSALYRENPNVTVLEKPVNGLSLIRQSDLVIGGGGTMNREAALLGVPVYSTFMGEKGAVDGYLESRGKLTFLRSEDDLSLIRLEKKKNGQSEAPPLNRVREFVLNEILNVTKRI